MAKLYASETAQDAAVHAMAIVGPESQLTSGRVERLYRDTPLMIIGEGTNEIQRLVICRNLLDRYGERAGALTARDGEPDERRQIVLAVRQLVDKEIIPAAPEDEARGRHPASLAARLGDLGVLGTLVPPELGGLGLDLATFAMIIEELARGWAAISALVGAQAIAGRILALLGSRGQHHRLVPAVTRGERRVLPAPGDSAGARRLGDGWVLSGRASLVEGAEQADFFLVRARADDGTPGAFLVERDAHRLALSAPHDTLGGRGLEPCDLVLDGVTVDGSARLADGAVAAADTLLRLRNAAVAVGVAQAAFDAALRYSQQRSAFGQPICQHQAIQLKLADMATRITASRLLTYRAAERLDADASDDSGTFMARLDATETAAWVTLEAMRIHGGYGYTREFPVERFYRDAAWLLTSPRDLAAERHDLARRWRQAVNG
jgi:alkylation response protein AidB-like acyl-CoA dehydrogenase